MKPSSLKITEVLFGTFKLDGGCMFGSVPKNLWSRSIPGDEENRIGLACRSLLIDADDRRFIIDVGMGEKWSEKQRQIYDIHNAPRNEWGFDPASVTDVILTHLHFDHAGGISYLDQAGELKLTFPEATVHLQRANWERAQNPSAKDRASYMKENIAPLQSAKLSLHEGDTEIYPGITLHRVDGHTPGQQWIEILSNSQRIFFTTDLIPTSHHVALPYHMGYDVCADTLLCEKQAFLDRAVSEQAVLYFQHDGDVAAARITVGARGYHEVLEVVELN
jgi:glyoxylase-like metal-dependent hydrolase (beta-lactamase superfamily II)